MAEIESGEYKRKYLVIVDESPECDRAVTFAANRVRRLGGTLVLLTVIEPPIDVQQWLGVEDVLRAEAREQAEQILDARMARMARLGPIRTETLIQEGRPLDAIERVVRTDPSIAILVLAASGSGEGPGPLITGLVMRSAGTALPVLIAIVPPTMSDEQIIQLA